MERHERRASRFAELRSRFFRQFRPASPIQDSQALHPVHPPLALTSHPTHANHESLLNCPLYSQFQDRCRLFNSWVKADCPVLDSPPPFTCSSCIPIPWHLYADFTQYFEKCSECGHMTRAVFLHILAEAEFWHPASEIKFPELAQFVISRGGQEGLKASLSSGSKRRCCLTRRGATRSRGGRPPRMSRSAGAHQPQVSPQNGGALAASEERPSPGRNSGHSGGCVGQLPEILAPPPPPTIPPLIHGPTAPAGLPPGLPLSVSPTTFMIQNSPPFDPNTPLWPFLHSSSSSSTSGSTDSELRGYEREEEIDRELWI